MNFKCPVCNEKLLLKDRNYRCQNNHVFDVAKEGYVNLLRKQGHKEYGDSVDMVKARREFFSKDYYHPLKERLAEIVKQYKPRTMIDLGCGEGYYTNYIYENYNCDIVGLDISKEAVRLASKANPDVKYVVGSVQDICLFNDSCDMISNLFTPLDLKEIKRVLKKDGHLVLVKVSKNHLLELKQALYDEVYLNDNKPLEDDSLKLVSSEVVEFRIFMDNNKDIVSLFGMTPYSHHTSLESKKRLQKLESLEVTCAFDVEVYCLND